MFSYASPLTRVFVSLVFAVIIALARLEVTLLICAVAIILSAITAKAKFKEILTMFKPLWAVLTVLFIVTAVTSGLTPAFLIMSKIVLITVSTSVLLATTTETEIEKGICSLLTPLSFFHVPVRDIAFVITLTLRYIPHITEEWDKLKIAREARGIIPNTLSMKNRFKITFQSIGTLLVNSAKNAEQTAMAMDSRCYGLGEFVPRKKDKLKKFDYIALTLFASFCIFLVLLEFLH